MERNPWWMTLDGQRLVQWSGPAGVKADGGGSIRGQGRVGSMKIHRAVHNKRLEGEMRYHDVPGYQHVNLLSIYVCGAVCCWIHHMLAALPAVLAVPCLISASRCWCNARDLMPASAGLMNNPPCAI
jgi:hypothetical protein